jgi:hypothetical protein
MAISATFTVDGNPVSGAMTTTYSGTVNLELVSATGARNIDWSIVGQSETGFTAPTITPAGSPIGKTASYTMIADPGAGRGAAFLVECKVTDSNGSSVTARAVIGVASTLTSLIPACSNEGSERHAHGWIDLLSYANGPSGSFTPPANPGDDYKMAYGYGGAILWADGVKVVSGSSETAVEISGYLALASSTATTGALRLPDSSGIYADGDQPILGIASNVITEGDDSITTGIVNRVKTSGTYSWYQNGVLVATLDDGVATADTDLVDKAFLDGRVPAVGAQHTVLTSTGSAGAWALLTNNNIDAAAAIAVSKLAAGSNDQILATVSSTPTWANLTDAMHGSLSGGSLHAAVSNSAAGFAPAVSATSGAIAYSSGTALVYSGNIRIGGDKLQVHYYDDATDYGYIVSGATETQFLRVTNGGTAQQFLSSSTTAVQLGASAGIATTDVKASTTINNYIGANVALELTAAGLTAKVGANNALKLTANTWLQYRDGAATTFCETYMYADAVSHRITVSGTGWYQYLYASLTTINLGDPTNIATTQVRASTTINNYIGANIALAITAAGLTAKVGAATGWELTSSGVFIYNQADVNDYLQIASLDTYSYIYRRTNTGGAQTVFGCSTTAVDVGATTGVATTTLNASTTIASAIGGNRVTSATSDGFRVYDQSAVTKYANFTLDSAGLLVTMAAQTGETSALDIEIRGGDSVYPSDPGDVIIRPGVNSGDERGTLYLCGYPMSGITITKGAGSNSAVCIDATYEGFFGATPIAKPTVTGSRGGNAAVASLCTQLANLGIITDSTS